MLSVKYFICFGRRTRSDRRCSTRQSTIASASSPRQPAYSSQEQQRQLPDAVCCHRRREPLCHATGHARRWRYFTNILYSPLYIHRQYNSCFKLILGLHFYCSCYFLVQISICLFIKTALTFSSSLL